MGPLGVTWNGNQALNNFERRIGLEFDRKMKVSQSHNTRNTTTGSAIVLYTKPPINPNFLRGDDWGR